MGPYVDSIIPDEVMPAATSVVVIGGGIIGTFCRIDAGQSRDSRGAL